MLKSPGPGVTVLPNRQEVDSIARDTIDETLVKRDSSHTQVYSYFDAVQPYLKSQISNCTS
jgi:hypothetical protein